MFNIGSKIVSKVKSIGTAVSTATLFAVAAVSTAYAQTGAPATPVELLQQQSTSFLSDTKDVLFAGAGLIIGGLLIKTLVNLVINFFRRG